MIRFSDAEVEVAPAAGGLILRIVAGRLQGLEVHGRFRLLPHVVVTALSVTPDDAAAIVERSRG